MLGTIFAFIGIIWPIRHNWSMVNYHSIFYVSFSVLIVLIELYSKSFGWGMIYVVPLFALGLSVYNFGMVLSNRDTRSEYILPMFILTVIAIISFIINRANHFIIWPSLSAFFATISFSTVLIVIRRTKVGKVLDKKLHF